MNTITPSPATRLSADSARALVAAGWRVDNATEFGWEWIPSDETGTVRITVPLPVDDDSSRRLRSATVAYVVQALRDAGLSAAAGDGYVLVYGETSGLEVRRGSSVERDEQAALRRPAAECRCHGFGTNEKGCPEHDPSLAGDFAMASPACSFGPVRARR